MFQTAPDSRYIWTLRLIAGTHGPACTGRLQPGRTSRGRGSRRARIGSSQGHVVAPRVRSGKRPQPALVRKRRTKAETDRRGARALREDFVAAARARRNRGGDRIGRRVATGQPAGKRALALLTGG